jgi:light-regulated signal transduction histidine kinase (bacteriophytochrome)
VPKKQRDKSERSGSFVFAHDLINQLAVIVGHCDLLKEEVEDTNSIKHVDSIKRTAIQMADGLKEYQRSLEEMKKAG